MTLTKSLVHLCHSHTLTHADDEVLLSLFRHRPPLGATFSGWGTILRVVLALLLFPTLWLAFPSTLFDPSQQEAKCSFLDPTLPRRFLRSITEERVARASKLFGQRIVGTSSTRGWWLEPFGFAKRRVLQGPASHHLGDVRMGGWKWIEFTEGE